MLSSIVRNLVRQHLRFFLAATAAAFSLRLIFILRFSKITDDSLIYGDIAKNWLLHGVYGLSGAGDISPTYIRLPGYPAFLAAIFAIFGMEHYHAAMFVQMFVDVATCTIIADIARRAISNRAAQAAFLLAALCPFLADYVSAPLTETLELFFTAIALDTAVIGIDPNTRRRMLAWIGCGLAVGATMLFRPDGGIILVAVEAFLVARLMKHLLSGDRFQRRDIRGCLTEMFIVAVCAFAPLVPWTLRNFHVFGQFEPLAPRYANEKYEFVPMGFNRWMKTWIADYSSTEAVYWNVPGDRVDASLLPSRTFDSPEQRQQTLQLIADYNQSLEITEAIDARFASLAAQRIRSAPLRYYLGLPALRILDMWLRPRTEKLPCNSRWWEFDEDLPWLTLMLALGVINLLYIGAAITGVTTRGLTAAFVLLLMFVLLRSAFLGSLENPEPRYTLECYPAVIVFASAWLAKLVRTPDSKSALINS